jgi:predicted membrane GTPase involved in stress response
LPQTPLFFESARARLTPLVVINKIDRPTRIEVLNEVMTMFIDLDANEIVDFPVLYTNAHRTSLIRGGGRGPAALFDAVVKHAALVQP